MEIQLTNALFENGTLTELYKSGFVSNNIFFYREIYLWVDAQIKTRAINKEAAIVEAQIKFDVGRTTIYKALKKFS